MNDQRTTMLTRYLTVARHSWDDEDYKARLLDSPREALAEHGWELPQDTEVEVAFAEPDEGGEQRSADQLAAAWEKETADGRLRLLIATEPPPGLETRELPDEQLEGAAGGLEPSVCFSSRWSPY